MGPAEMLTEIMRFSNVIVIGGTLG